LLLSEIEQRKELIFCLDGLAETITHGDLKINNSVFRQDEKGNWRCVALIDLDTMQKGKILDDLGDALRSAGNPAGEQPESLDLVRIDKEIVDNLISGFLDRTNKLYSDGSQKVEELKKYVYKAYGQFLYIQGIRFFADSLVGNSYFRLDEGEPEDLNLYRAEVQIRTLLKLEEIVGSFQSIPRRNLKTQGLQGLTP